jgi:hypothetical protein
MKVTEGSKWMGGDHKRFHVIHVIEIDGHTWVHYISDDTDAKEYSCYIESFVERFSPHVNA